MSRTAGDVRARATVAALDGARGVAPAPELVPPTPAEESTVQRDSRPRFSTWAGRCGWLGNGLIALLVSVITGTNASNGRRIGVWWYGLPLTPVGLAFPDLNRGAVVAPLHGLHAERDLNAYLRWTGVAAG